MTPPSRRTRVLIIDDSAIVRKILSDTLSAEADLEVVGTAPDPVIAKEKIARLRPDVLTLDIEMPRMNGLTFLRDMMATQPIPAVVISSIAQTGCSTALEAMEAGAVEVLAKPHGPYSIGDLRLNLAAKVRAAAQARIRTQRPPGLVRAALNPPSVRVRSHYALIAIGASTGGTEAIRLLLEELPADLPPVLIVQHIPPVFSKSFANRLNELCRLTVREAIDGELVKPGVALVAPGDYHMVLRRSMDGLLVQVRSGPRICYQRPSVDVLFQSVADVMGSRAIGVILTGMGNDGAAGMLRMRKAGAHTFAQDEATCVVYGMPKEAIRMGAVDTVLPLHRLPEAISSAARMARGSNPADRAR